MRDAGWRKTKDTLRGSVNRRVLEAIKLVREEMVEPDVDTDLPEMPAGVLMKKGRPEGGRVGQ